MICRQAEAEEGEAQHLRGIKGRAEAWGRRRRRGGGIELGLAGKKCLATYKHDLLSVNEPNNNHKVEDDDDRVKHFLPTDLLLEATTSSTASPSRAKGTKKSAVRHAESVNPVAFYADDGEQGWRQLGWLRATARFYLGDSFLGK